MEDCCWAVWSDAEFAATVDADVSADANATAADSAAVGADLAAVFAVNVDSTDAADASAVGNLFLKESGPVKVPLFFVNS